MQAPKEISVNNEDMLTKYAKDMSTRDILEKRLAAAKAQLTNQNRDITLK